MSTLKYAILGVLTLGAFTVAPKAADASMTNRTKAWCKPKAASDATIISDASASLIWKTTGELVLEPTNHLATKIWSSGTADQGDKLCWETSGAFAIYNAAGTKLWSQSGGSVPSNPFFNLDYVIEPSMSACNVSAKYTAYLPVPSSIPFKGFTIETGKLWTKTGVCPSASRTAVGGTWCMDTTSEQVVLEEDWSQLVWKPAGFLALLGTGSAAGAQIWQTSTAGAGKKLCFEDDGQLVIYDAVEHPIWSTSASATTTGYTLGLDDCSMEINRLDGGTSPWTSAHRCPQAQLALNKEFFVGSSDLTVVENDDAKLVFDHTGNLVLRSLAGDQYWTSALAAGRGKRLAFQSDGNLVIYDSANQPAWGAKMWDHTVTSMVLDGCSVSLLAGTTTKWSRGSSACAKASLSNTWSLSNSGNTTLLRSTESRLVWQADGNLVLYTTSGTALWSTGTAGTGKTLAFQSDGNLVIYSNSGAALWDSNTNVSSSVTYALKLGDSCTLTIASGSTVKWTGIDSCAVVNYSFEQSDGNSVFGSTMRTELTAEDSGTARVDSTTAIDVTIFGTSHELLSATAYQTESDSGSDLGNVVVTIFGESAISVNVTYEQTFFEIEKTFIVGVVPVTVTAGASGELGLGLSYAGGTLTATPSAGIYATVQAGVGAENDAAGASAGIRGSLTLIEIGLPIAMKVYVENQRAKYSLSGSLDIDTLSGSFELYAEAYVKVFGVKIGVDWSKTIFSWDGVSWNKSLFSKTGSF